MTPFRVIVLLALAFAGFVSRLSADPVAEPITSVATIRSLSREEAAKALPVKLTGVVIYLGWENFVIHDGQASIFADFRFSKAKGFWKGRVPDLGKLVPGAGVEIEGVTDPGGFSPMVLVTKYQAHRQRAIPPPLRPSTREVAFQFGGYPVGGGRRGGPEIRVYRSERGTGLADLGLRRAFLSGHSAKGFEAIPRASGGRQSAGARRGAEYCQSSLPGIRPEDP